MQVSQHQRYSEAQVQRNVPVALSDTVSHLSVASATSNHWSWGFFLIAQLKHFCCHVVPVLYQYFKATIANINYKQRSTSSNKHDRAPSVILSVWSSYLTSSFCCKAVMWMWSYRYTQRVSVLTVNMPFWVFYLYLRFEDELIEMHWQEHSQGHSPYCVIQAETNWDINHIF